VFKLTVSTLLPFFFFFLKATKKVHKPTCHNFNSVDITLLAHLSLPLEAVASQAIENSVLSHRHLSKRSAEKQMTKN
jgi:hypothetical protein